MPETRSSVPFHWPVRVYIEDTDAGGIVFYANYLRYMERARTEFIRSLGFPRIETVDESVMFVVHSLNIRYRAPARLDDELTVTAKVSQIGKTFMDFEQTVRRGPQMLVEAAVKVACIDRQRLRPHALPETLKLRLHQIT